MVTNSTNLSPVTWDTDPLADQLRQAHQASQSESLAVHNWFIFHFSTRLKLEGASYHWNELMHINRSPQSEEEDHEYWKIRHWQLDGFFSQLTGAIDVLLQEINAIYELGLDTDKVSKDRVVRELKRSDRELAVINYIERRWSDQWFENIRMYRNASNHRHYLPTSTVNVGYGSPPYLGRLRVYMLWPGEDEREPERLEACRRYLRNVRAIVFRSWKLMADDWPVAITN